MPLLKSEEPRKHPKEERRFTIESRDAGKGKGR